MLDHNPLTLNCQCSRCQSDDAELEAAIERNGGSGIFQAQETLV